MENKQIEILWKEIDKLISEAEVHLFDAFDIFEKDIDLPTNLFRAKLNKPLEKIYIYVIKILEKINFIVKNKIYHHFFLEDCTEVIAILNYSHEWLQKNFIYNKINFNEIYDYNYWKSITFFKLTTSCLDKISFLIFHLENKKIWDILNKIKSKKERDKQIQDIYLKIKFDTLIKNLEKDKELITIFNDLKIFYEKVKESTFWKISKDGRNFLEHKIFSLNKKISDFSTFTIINLLISLKSIWFLNIKTNETGLRHFEKIWGTKNYKIIEPTLICLLAIIEKKQMPSDISNEIQQVAYLWFKALSGENINWKKYSFIEEPVLNIILKSIKGTLNYKKIK